MLLLKEKKMFIKKEHKGLYFAQPNYHGLQTHFVEEEEEEDTNIGAEKMVEKLRYKGVKEIIGK